MINVLNYMERANHEWIMLDERGIRKALFYDLAERCGFTVIRRPKQGNNKYEYRLKKLGISREILYTREEKTTINYLDIADLHIGSQGCDFEKLRRVLNEAVDRGVDYVFIAGDILEGTYTIKPQDARDEFTRQAEMATKIFRDYDLDFRVIPGNHDFSFDVYQISSPLKTLEMMLEGEKCKFKAYDGYIQDFEMAGVIKRVMHLESYYAHENVVTVIERLNEFATHGGLKITIENGDVKPIRFLTCGHIHRTCEIYEPDYNVYISQPGSFVKGQCFYKPAIFVKGEILDDLRVVRG